MSSPRDLLVIDDEQVVRGAVGKVCRAEGIAVDEAETVDDGLERLARRRYRIVLLDLMLPAGGGMRVLEAMGQDHPKTPVVMITGYATPRRKVECIHGGAFDVLPKPFDANELVAVLRRALEFVEVPAGDLAGERPAGVFALGQHAWARLEDEGTAAVGIGASFHPLLDGFRQLETPASDTELVQGERMATVTGRDGLVHRVWSPLSGKVLKTESTWTPGRSLLHIVPTDLENELEQLIRI